MNDIDLLEQRAVEAAINLHWEAAIRQNLDILKIDPVNLSAFLRLGFAYLQLNQPKEAKRYYRKALKIQPKNSVALDNLERIKVLEVKGFINNDVNTTQFNPYLFIEIPGKTKTVTLVNPGPKNVLAKLLTGQAVVLKIKKRRVEVRTVNNEYIGSLPDDLSKRMIYFLNGNCLYSTYIREADINHAVAFIKEEKKTKQTSGNISFPSNTTKTIVVQDQSEEDKETENDEADESDTDWEKMANELVVEEKEEVVGIHTDDDEEEEE